MAQEELLEASSKELSAGECPIIVKKGVSYVQ